ncbi:MAG: GPP34 family phosphoprotein, partial [Deltaproteobacteria bacterium]|nr:GPP34 family phosphoprotein [Deltaproteobacteria bacterium]
MLTFAEEILLLNLDDKKGTFRHLPEEALRTALAGALLLELALANRIDTDQHALVLVDSRPMHDSLLDDILRRIKAEKAAPRPVGHWLQEVASEAGNPQDRVLQGLVDKGVLKVEDRKVLWVFAQRRYPLVDGQEVVEVRTRLRALIFSDD